MDILHLIKEEHVGIKNLITELVSKNSAGEKRVILSNLEKLATHHLRLEREFLYPEVKGHFSDLDRFINKSSNNHRVIKSLITEIKALLDVKKLKMNATIEEKIQNLANKFSEHLTSEEDELFPKIRTGISTQDREDLAQIFLDIREEANVVH